MKSLEEIMARVNALKKDLEDLGVDVTVAVTVTSADVGPAPVVDLRLLVSREIKEGLE